MLLLLRNILAVCSMGCCITATIGCTPDQPTVNGSSSSDETAGSDLDIDVPGADIEVQTDEDNPSVDVDLEQQNSSH